MNIRENVSLKEYTTFKIGGPARFFCEVSSESELLEAVAVAKKQKLRIMILGGGSNILISDAGFPGMVVKCEIMGQSVISMGGNAYKLSVGAGEQWDDVVEHAVSHGLYGIETLSAIPGTAGAAPVQNIGAYGSEIAETVMLVRALDLVKMKFVEFNKKGCAFEYRDSIFKKRKGRYVITRVDLKMSSRGSVNISYRDLQEYFKNVDPKRAALHMKPTLKEVRDAVIAIRWKKLPDWKLWGTAGSFFKNPILSKRKFDKLKARYPELPGYPEPDGKVKVPLAWILDHVCHVKGQMDGNVGPYENQALVLVTKPGATAAQVVARAKELMDMVEKATGIKVEAEVEWVN